jgi:cell division protein FtsB
VFNLQKVIKGLEDERLGKTMHIRSLQRRTSKLKQEEETTKQNLEKLKNEEYNRWYGLYGNGNKYYTNQ